MILLGGLALAAGLTVIYLFWFVGRRDSKLPPGPPTLPIIGNLHQIPTKRTHLKFTEWAKQYGEIFSLKVGPGTTIVITSPRLIRQLVDKKSSIYNHRPTSYIGNRIISGGDHLLIMQYSDRWRTCRKLVHQFFMESMVVKHHVDVVDAEAVQMLRDFVVDPQGHMRHPKRFSNSIIMSLIYGTRTPSIKTRHMVKLYDVMEEWSKVMEPGNTPPVDIFPFLKWVPESLLGMWRSRAGHVGKEMNALYSEWVEYVVQRRKDSGSRDCFVDRVLDQEGKVDIDRHGLYFLCGTLMEGGSDTTSSILIAFIHAITKWPEVLKKAQAEVDAVVGGDRTPTWDDYAKLPYIASCVKEGHRWRPVVPLAFPHALAEDDWVDGYKLPKGSDVFVNAYGMHHDEKRFKNPDVFDPDHYKGVTALASELANGEYANRDHYGYGSGRRLCPGIHLAERNLFVAMAKLVWAFDIGPGRDASGKVIEPNVGQDAYSSGFLVCAEDFPCTITMRSEERKATILREYETAKTQVFSRYETPKE
ncbi:putative cytochrome P450 [Coniochaeta ligniaria NRRL 30616]|uniref:Putative cytochrome P450 n=1 Tax=Coniochaeta ligniaria NRRL 30616 TaxID=1408157 RepID=A0A1J7JCT7_9PEZI|nr:putative cytochrome P450 [Coniochaeta ligniaria NRRL 30616]